MPGICAEGYTLAQIPAQQETVFCANGTGNRGDGIKMTQLPVGSKSYDKRKSWR